MDSKYSIKAKVKTYYWDDDFNCATTNIKILSEIFSISLARQVVDAAIGMHGAGKYGIDQPQPNRFSARGIRRLPAVSSRESCDPNRRRRLGR